MDFKKLVEILPKHPQNWSLEDMSSWLNYIGLSQYEQQFTIDGSCIFLLEEQDLKDDIQIQSNIVRKKLLNWTKTILPQFGQYLLQNQIIPPLEQQFQMEIETTKIETMINLSNNEQNKMHYYKQLTPVNDKMAQSVPTNIAQNQNNKQIRTLNQQQVATFEQSNERMDIENFDQQKIEYEIIIVPTEGAQTTYYKLNEQGGKIGRHSNNQIVIMEESVSRQHAEILFNLGNFYIKDTRSSTGSFIKISEHQKITVGMIIEMGSNQYIIEQIDIMNESIDVIMQVLEGPDHGQTISFSLNEEQPFFKVGRKQENNLTVPDDQHLSNLHARFFLIDGEVHIEDMSSTNGTWRRLSKEGTNSSDFPLQDQDCIKIGSVSTFRVKITCSQIQSNLSKTKEKQECIICCENEKDTLYMPCRHNAACMKCSKNLLKCPICQVKIDDYIKIFKA